MTWVETRGVMPRCDKAFVRYRCGIVSKQAYTVKTQRWSLDGSDFDIMDYAVPGELAA